LRKHRAHDRGGDDAFVALLFALERGVRLQLLGTKMLGLADMQAATAATRMEASAGIERIVEGGHRLLPEWRLCIRNLQSLCHAAGTGNCDQMSTVEAFGGLACIQPCPKKRSLPKN